MDEIRPTDSRILTKHSTLLNSLIIKNKRKNFSPRFSASNDDGDGDISLKDNVANTIEIYSNEPDCQKKSCNLNNRFKGIHSKQENLNSLTKKLCKKKKSATKTVAAAAAAAAAVVNFSKNDGMDGTNGGLKLPKLDDQESKFRDFAFKTMQELLNIYGLSISPHDIVDAFKQQTSDHDQVQGNERYSSRKFRNNSDSANENGEPQMEPPTPPRTPINTPPNEINCIENENKIMINQDEKSKSENIFNLKSELCDSDKNNNDEDNDNDEDSRQRHHNKSSLRNRKNRETSDSMPSSRSSSSSSLRSSSLSQSLQSSQFYSKCDNSDRDTDNTTDSLNINKNQDSEKSTSPLAGNVIDLFSPILQLAKLSDSERQIAVAASYSETFKKFQSYLDCSHEKCQEDNIREHYHCYEGTCYGRLLNKKEEIIRHLKWHKKRNESLNHGFLRFSSSDDCTLQFGAYCQHNRKQTHYHCIQSNCDKIYISTSDVQMHSNYHRKDTAIIQEGFQRFRATEGCDTDYCLFAGQRTTHFHCRRFNCVYTFKNKADMEKHKTYHIKDEQLAKDGFKKFLKSELCPYENCRFSRVCNHIHCTRENCQYVLHSSGQLLSHKRKHERIDSETAYRRFKLAQKADDIVPPPEFNLTKLNSSKSFNIPSTIGLSPEVTVTVPLPAATTTSTSSCPSPFNNFNDFHTTSLLPAEHSQKPNSFDLSSIYENARFSNEIIKQIKNQQQLLRASGLMAEFNSYISTKNKFESKEINETEENIEEEIPQNIIQNSSFVDRMENMKSNYNPNQLDSHTLTNLDNIEQVILQYFTDNCTKQQLGIEQNEPLNLKSPNAELKSKNSIVCFMQNHEPHLHCLVRGCEAVLPRSLNDVSNHMRMHEITRDTESILLQSPSNLLQITSIEGFFNRKRGRPPKNRVVEVYNSAQQSPQAIFTSFKLEKNEQNVIFERQSTSTQNVSNQISQISTNLNPTIKSKLEIINDDQKNIEYCQESKINSLKNQILMFQGTSSLDDNEQSNDASNVHKLDKCLHKGCIYLDKLHFHCNISDECQFGADKIHNMESHLLEYHNKGYNKNEHENSRMDTKQVSVLDGFRYYDKTVSCHSLGCIYNGQTNHYHCQICEYTFIHPFEMTLHVCKDDLGYKTNQTKLNSMLISQIKDPAESFKQKINKKRQYSVSSEEDYLKSKKNIIKSTNTQPILKSSNNTTSAIPKTLPLNFIDCSTISSSTDMHNNLAAAPISVNSTTVDRANLEDKIKSQGTYFPSNSDLQEQPQSPSTSSITSQVPLVSTPPLTAINDIIDLGFETSLPCQRPFCKLKKKSHHHCNLCNQAFSEEIKLKIHYIKHQSTKLGRQQFLNVDEVEKACKLKNKFMASSPSAYAESVLFQQSLLSSPNKNLLTSYDVTNNLSPSISVEQQIENFKTSSTNLVQNISFTHSYSRLDGDPYSYVQLNPFYNQETYPLIGVTLDEKEISSQIEQQQTPAGKLKISSYISEAIQENLLQAFASGKFDIPKYDFVEHQIKNTQKRKSHDDMLMTNPKLAKQNNQSSTQSMSSGLTLSVGKVFKDEAIPNGYTKFRFNEDCNFSVCGYRNHQSHFHCCRVDCFYSFCDKTRFVQHTARHERLDKLMGDDFKQYRANMRCGFDECVYNKNLGPNNKSSHFHCLKCDFICSDTNKVVAHRRQHSKMEYIRMAGFRKVANNEQCTSKEVDSPNGECSSSLKQTHYHCLVCDASVLSRAQLGSHRHRV